MRDGSLGEGILVEGLLLRSTLNSHLPHGSLEGLGGGAALLQGAKAGLDALGERLAGGTLEALHPLLHAPIGADPEMDGLLRHPC
jgi:hypothetical protein